MAESAEKLVERTINMGRGELTRELIAWQVELRKELKAECAAVMDKLLGDIEVALPHLPSCTCDTEVGYRCPSCYIAITIHKARTKTGAPAGDVQGKPEERTGLQEGKSR